MLLRPAYRQAPACCCSLFTGTIVVGGDAAVLPGYSLWLTELPVEQRAKLCAPAVDAAAACLWAGISLLLKPAQ
jgi:hypothetical protein